jgi:hypothetical protein
VIGWNQICTELDFSFNLKIKPGPLASLLFCPLEHATCCRALLSTTHYTVEELTCGRHSNAATPVKSRPSLHATLLSPSALASTTSASTHECNMSARKRTLKHQDTSLIPSPTRHCLMSIHASHTTVVFLHRHCRRPCPPSPHCYTTPMSTMEARTPLLAPQPLLPC